LNCGPLFAGPTVVVPEALGARSDVTAPDRSSIALRAADPGGGGGAVRGLLRSAAGATGTGVAADLGTGVAADLGTGVAADVGDGLGVCAGTGDGGSSPSSDHPDARSAIRFFVSSPRRRRRPSSSGTARP